MAIVACERFNSMNAALKQGPLKEPGWLSGRVGMIYRAGVQSDNAAVASASETMYNAVQPGVPVDAGMDAMFAGSDLMEIACRSVLPE